MALVTVGIPFFHDKDTLELAVRSTINQTFKDWQLILLDDGGHDGTLEVARKLAEQDSRITVLSDGMNKKLPARLNEIISLSDTPFVARMDADDIMHPQRLEKEVDYLLRHPEVDLVGTDAYSIDSNGHILGLKKIPRIPQNIKEVFRQSIFIHPSVMGKTSWFQANPYCEGAHVERAEDYELWCRTFKASKFALIEEPLYFCREGQSIIKSVDNQIKTYNSVLWVLKNYGPKECDSIYLNKLEFKIFCKKLVYKYGFKTGLLNVLLPHILKKRYTVLDHQELERGKKLLEKSLRGYSIGR